MMHRQETPLTFEQATITAATSFLLPLGKVCRYFFAFFVPSSQASFARQLTRLSWSSPL